MVWINTPACLCWNVMRCPPTPPLNAAMVTTHRFQGIKIRPTDHHKQNQVTKQTGDYEQGLHYVPCKAFKKQVDNHFKPLKILIGKIMMFEILIGKTQAGLSRTCWVAYPNRTPRKYCRNLLRTSAVVVAQLSGPSRSSTARDASRNDSLQWCGCTTMVHDDFLVDIAHHFPGLPTVSSGHVIVFCPFAGRCNITEHRPTRGFCLDRALCATAGHQCVYRHGPYVGSQPIFFYSKPWWKSVFFVKMDQNDWPNRPERHEFLGKTSNLLGNKLFWCTILAVDLPSHIWFH